MLFLQIRQAEVAMADGRLDEAYGLLAASADLRSHRRGQALVTSLVKQLAERAKKNQSAGRLAQALVDCEKAQQLGGDVENVVALRSQIESEIVSSDQARRQQAKAGMVATAAQLVDSAMGRQDLDRAVTELVRARGNGISDTKLREFDADVRGKLMSQIESALNTGRLDQVDALMERLQRLDAEGMATRQFASVIERARQAWAAISRGSAYEAQEILHRLAALQPSARWIKDVLEHLSSAEESLRAVRTGPLGLLSLNQGIRKNGTVSPVAWAGHRRDNMATVETLPTKLILQVDGAGSYLVLCQPSVTIGPISSSRAPDIGLIAEPGAGMVTIERKEDDYFLRPANPGTAGKLLAAGERIGISPKCRLTFGLPSPSSTSAVLDLSTGRFPRADVRRVILLDRDLIVGPGSTAHVRVDQLKESFVLHIRDGRLWCRTQAVELNTPTSIAGVSFVVTKG